jgi:hypothetical protein
MIIATSGNSYINYNRILSSSSPPYPVYTSISKTFRDPNISGRRLFALHIINKNLAIGLINDPSTSLTYLASIDFLAPSISY